jgi:hypothetical protein
VVFLDVLGMKGIWNRKPVIKIVNSWKNVIRYFMNALQQNHNTEYYLRALSDTIILTLLHSLDYAIIEETFDILLAPFVYSLKEGMLLRGAISHGQYYLSNQLIIGEAVDDAAYIHDKLNWIGISLTPDLSDKINDITFVQTQSIVMYDNIPHKTSPYRGFALNWPFYDETKECFSAIQNETVSCDSSVIEKRRNTIMFYESCRHNITY